MPTLKELRLSRRLTLLAVSQGTGISLSALSKYENGMSAINAKNQLLMLKIKRNLKNILVKSLQLFHR